MIHEVHYIKSDQTLPYHNLALEEYLLMSVQPGQCILYLWQNRCTVVIGRNQNSWKECRTADLEKDGGYLVRRLSGGGAVFHDLGNLNFTFLVRQEDYDVGRQLDVILRALQKMDIHAEKSGRNDITVDGHKVSGNAFYTTHGHCYHHGTLLLHVDMERLFRYLNVSPDKLQLKGIDSVRARVANLTEFNPDATVELVSRKLIDAFGEVYGYTPQEIPLSAIDSGKVDRLTQKFSAREWNYGHRVAFTYEFFRRFDWGDIQFQIKVNEGEVAEAIAFSDALDPHFITQIPKALIGCAFSSATMAQVVSEIPTPSETIEKMSADICVLLLEQDL